MARRIHSNYYEDIYQKHQCQTCKRAFITGEKLSENMDLTCPYCGSRDIQLTAASTEETAEEMDMGCLGIYFYLYSDGQLMLHTENEFAQALAGALKNGEEGGIPLGAVGGIITAFCAERDGRGV